MARLGCTRIGSPGLLGVVLGPLQSVLDGYELIAQSRWAAWRRRQRRDELRAAVAGLLAAVIDFADPILTGRLTEPATWRPDRCVWEWRAPGAACGHPRSHP